MSTCRWVASDQPRAVVGEHYDGCEGDCEGCWPCRESHCRACRRVHAEGTCAACVGNVRDDLTLIGDLCAAPMHEEAEHRGIDSEAMMLVGPTADVATWERRKRLVVNAAVASDEGSQEHKILRAWVEDCRDELHPLWVLGTWEMVWRDHLSHDTDALVTIDESVRYLGDQLTYMAQQAEPDFAQFASEIRSCRGHLEDVLHDQRQGDTGAPCPECPKPGPALRKVYADRDTSGASDRWVCPRDREHWWTEASYRLRIADDHLANAEDLTIPDMERRTQVAAGTIRRWASKTTVRRDGATVEVPAKLAHRGRSEDGRRLYRVEDVLALKVKGESAESGRVA